MDFIDRVDALSKRISQVKTNLATEEATKTALVMPFLHNVLGYDIFNPSEVVPEFTADTATKKGEKVDYAILKEGHVQVLIECKKYGEELSLKHASQLFRYFSVTNARIAILTNGSVYQFYTDLDAPNKMDEKPFLTVDFEDLDEHTVPEVKKLTKASFDIESIVDAAGELKYMSEIKRLVASQFRSPEEDFVKFFAARVYSGILTTKVKTQFTEITHKALRQFLSDSINDRLKSAIGEEGDTQPRNAALRIEGDQSETELEETDQSKINTTEEELEGYNIVKAILRKMFDVGRIAHRDTQSYFGILLDDNNRKPLCRLHFNAKQKYVGIFDSDKKENRIPIDSVDDIYKIADEIIASAKNYVQEQL